MKDPPPVFVSRRVRSRGGAKRENGERVFFPPRKAIISFCLEEPGVSFRILGFPVTGGACGSGRMWEGTHVGAAELIPGPAATVRLMDVEWGLGVREAAVGTRSTFYGAKGSTTMEPR